MVDGNKDIHKHKSREKVRIHVLVTIEIIRTLYVRFVSVLWF